MMFSLVSFAALFLAWAAPASAQQTSQYWQCQPPSTANPQGGYCAVNTIYPLPSSVPILGLLPVAGTQVGLSIAASTGFTIPTGATVALVQAQGTNAATGGACLFWRDDGSAPTASAGQVMVANQSLYVKATSAFKMFAAATATCTATISYYK